MHQPRIPSKRDCHVKCRLHLDEMWWHGRTASGRTKKPCHHYKVGIKAAVTSAAGTPGLSEPRNGLCRYCSSESSNTDGLRAGAQTLEIRKNQSRKRYVGLGSKSLTGHCPCIVEIDGGLQRSLERVGKQVVDSKMQHVQWKTNHARNRLKSRLKALLE